MTEIQTATFEQWAILEVMGHRRLAGLVSEATIAGAGFIRIDIPKTAEKDGDQEFMTTQFYRPDSIYAITPTTEAIARAVANNTVFRPVERYELTAPTNNQNDEEYPW